MDIINETTGRAESFCPTTHIVLDSYHYSNKTLLLCVTDNKIYKYISRHHIPSQFNNYIEGFEKDITYFFNSINTANKHGFYESLESDHFCIKSKIHSDVKYGCYRRYDNLTSTPSKTYKQTGYLKYSFGVEMETIIGRVTPMLYRHFNLNLSCVRDGSLRNEDGDILGGEYVTGVLYGDKGMNNLKRSADVLSTRTLVDKRCAMHVHIGNFKNTKQFAVLATLLGYKIQNELFETLPPSRQENNFANKLFKTAQNIKTNINHYGYSYGISESYKEIYEKLLNHNIFPKRVLGSNFNKNKEHPGGKYTDRYQENLTLNELPRYDWINLIPCMFNTRYDTTAYTIEFRPHGGTTNFTKIKNWILFCMAFVNYVENYQMKIINNSKITINDILTTIYPPYISNSLVDYFKKRKELFTEDRNRILNEKKEYLNKLDCL